MSLLDLPVRRPVAVGMLFLALAMLGLVAWQRLPMELMPVLQGDTLSVSFWRRGAEPEVVEREILLPLHAKVSGLPLVAESGGSVRGSSGSYWVRFESGGDIKVRELELRRIAADIQRQQPRNSAGLQVQSTESSTAGQGSFVMMVHVLGAVDRNTLFDLVDELLVPRFAAVPGVSEAIASGGARRQVSVSVDLGRTTAAAVSPEALIGGVNRRVKQLLYAGALESEAGRMDVLVDGRPAGLQALRSARVGTDNPAELRHVADVDFGFAPEQSAFRVNGEPAVGIVVFQEQGANLIRLGRELRERVDQVRAEVAPLGLDLVIGNDAAELVEEQVGYVAKLGLSGYLIALAVLFLFLRQWRAVAVVGIAVPTSVLVALAFLYLLGQTLNLISMVGLSLSIGLLIDNSIVVYEAVLRRLERGADAAGAARRGIRRTVRAIAAGSLTTAVLFLPITLVDLGPSAKLIEILALSFLAPLVASLLVAVGLVPVLAVRLAAPAALRRVERQRALRTATGGRVAPDPARILFGGLVASALRRPSALLAGTIFAVLLTALTAVPFAISNTTVADADNADEVQFVTRFGKGISSVKALGDAVGQVEQAVLGLAGVDTVMSDIAQDRASITVTLVDLDERPAELTVERVRNVAEEAAKKVKGFELLRPGEDQQSGRGGGGDRGRANTQTFGGAPSEIVISGPESTDLDRLARDLVARLDAVPSIGRAWQWTPPGMEELWVQPRPQGFEAFGLTVAEVLPLLRLTGREGMPIDERFLLPSGRELPVVIERQGARDENGVRDLRRLRVHTQSGTAQLGALAAVRQMPPPPMIAHHNGRREMSVYFRLTRDAPTSGPAANTLDAEIAAVVHAVPRPPGYTIEIKEDDENETLVSRLLIPMLLLVLLVLAMTFESLTLPVLVVLAWPLAVLGATWLLVITNTAPGVMVIAGVGVLIGLSVNPAILLVDRMQQRIRAGGSAGAAALASVRERTRPVLMTSATTIAALWPLAVVSGRENELWPPFATVVIGGLVTSTLLTLVVVPVAFILLRRLDALFGRVGPWLVVVWLAVTLASVLSLTLTDVITSMLWQVITSLLIGGGLLAVTVLLFRRQEVPIPDTGTGPPVLDVRNLRKVYGLPGPLRRAIRAPREFTQRVLAEGGTLAAAGRFDASDAVPRFGPALLLVAAPLFLSSYVQSGGWTLVLWLLGAAFGARLLTDIRRARGLADAAGEVLPGGAEAFLRFVLPWGALAAFGYWMIVGPYLAGEPTKAAWLWPVLAAALLGIGQLARSSAVRQQRGELNARARAGWLRYPRTMARRWALRLGGFDLPVRPIEALTGVSFRVERGMVGILGPNGAGKTTLLRQLAGILDPTRGAIQLGGVPLIEIQRVLARWVGYLPQDAGMPGGLSAREYLDYFAALYDLPAGIRRERVNSLLAEVGLGDKADDKIKSLSGGMRQRVAVARTLLRLPPVIIVDEPTVGLDPRERIRFRNLLARLAEDRIVLFSTHVVEDVAVACERVLVLAGGHLVFDGKPAALADAAVGRVWQTHGAAMEEFVVPAGAILAEEAPAADGTVVRRIVADQPPTPDAEPLEARLEDGYLVLIANPNGTAAGST